MLSTKKQFSSWRNIFQGQIVLCNAKKLNKVSEKQYGALRQFCKTR